MIKLRPLLHALWAISMLFATGTTPALAQREVTRLIVPFSPGAANDTIGRLVAEGLSQRTGRTVIVENKPGAGSIIGTTMVSNAEPDGKTLLLAASDGISILPAVRTSTPYQIPESFTFLGRIATSPFSVAINSALPIKDFDEFVSYAKRNPGSLRVGHSGIGAIAHMAGAFVTNVLDVRILDVPYKGMGPVINDLLAGHIDVAFISPATISPYVNDGKVRVLTTLDASRSRLLPDVPAVTELRHPDLCVIGWWGLLAPANLDPAEAEFWSNALKSLLQDKTFAQRLNGLGFDPAPLSGKAFEDYVVNDLRHWSTTAERAKIQIKE